MNTTEAKFLVYMQKKYRKQLITPIMQAVTHSADGGAVWFAMAGGMLCFKVTKDAAINCLFAMGENALVVNGLIKNIVARHRPYIVEPDLEPAVKHPRDYSFPSGHTAISFAAATALYASGYKNLGMGALCYAALVGFSRIYLGVHYPTDVIGGAVIGTLIGLHVAK